MTENNQKKKLFLDTLTSAYNHKEYVHFLQELLNDVQLVAPGTFNKEYSSLSAVIEGHYHIGNYKGSDGKKMALFAVQLQNKGNVENARSTQRAFIKALLDNSGCDSALAAFYTMEKDSNGYERPSDKWRLSLVRMEYGFAEGKLSTKLTPAKRYSYLVGKDEPCHTAQERLYDMFVQDEVNHSLNDLEEAFSVETVTKQFFNDYKEKYLAVKEYLEATPDFMAEAERCGFTSEQFTKKLMGQIVFLYFIQKKGWLGVQAFPVRLTDKEYKSALFRNAKAHSLIEKVYSQPDNDGISRIDQKALFALSDEDAKFVSTLVKGKAWGEGPKNFMRSLYESCVKRGKNYFDDYLEPLFYEALNVNRGENGFYARFHCRVPFLNGGLFEQLDNYDWVNSDFHIPNEMFSNADTKGKDEADGILDIFDRYNFTMAEDEPMEREVAIDPEMLGKVFENLLDVKDRKSKGAFYTPREIVHYMCQESLINHLATSTGIIEEDIRKFILYGEYFRDSDCLKTKEVYKDGKRSYTIDKEREMEMPESIFSFKSNVNRLKEIDDLLENIKIADLAVGSGAFLLGLLNEIVRARQTLSAYMAIEMNGFQRLNFYAYGRKTYDLKVNTIKNCLFACDLEPSATDITKLRLWLSIVIDDETVKQDNSDGMFDVHTEPRQLPNLDCNVICGNSLVDEFEGISLITESRLLKNQSKLGMDSFFQAGFDNMLRELIKLQDELYFTKEHETKKQIKDKIHDIYDTIILHQIGSNLRAVDNYNRIKTLSQQPFILWQLYFPKVFREKRGFDIVIGNPPYIKERDNSDVFEPVNNTKFGKKYHQGKMDYWYYFLHKAIDITNKTGHISFITPRYWINGAGASKLIERIQRELSFDIIVDIGKLKVFDNVVGLHMICQYSKSKHDELLYKKLENSLEDLSKMSDTENLKVKVLDNEKIISSNEIVLENRTAYEGTVHLGDIADISQGVVEASDKISNRMYKKNPRTDMFVGKGIFVLSKNEIDALNLSNKEKDLLVPYVDGNDMSRYFLTENARNWLIYSDKQVKTIIAEDNDYVRIKNHLDYMSEYITSSNAPYGIHRPRKRYFFESPKIIMPSMFATNDFVIDYNNNYYVGMSFQCIVIINKQYLIEYVLAILNSTIAKEWFYSYGKKRGAGVDIGVDKIRTFPIMPCEMEIQIKIANKVKLLMQNYERNIKYDKEIDELISGIYGGKLCQI